MANVLGGGQQQQSFCLKWNNYQSSVTSTFKELLADEDFVDITLTADGGALKAHKVVLSACSPYFRDILKGISSWQHPVIVLKDVPYSDLQGIVEFIYHGEVAVLQESLTSFLKTAQILKVKGLTEESGNAERGDFLQKKHHSRKSSRPAKRLCLDEDAIKDEAANARSDDEAGGAVEAATPPKRSNPSLETSNKASDEEEEEEEEIDDVEDEDLEEEEEEAPPADAMSSFRMEQDLDKRQRQQAHMTGGDISIAGMDPNAFASSISLSSTLKLLGNSSTNGPDVISAAMANVLANVAVAQGQQPPADSMNLSMPLGADGSPLSPEAANAQKKTCPYCHQQLSWHALSRHIRDMHRAKTGLVTCKYCFKTFRNKNSLGCHMWRFHKEMREREQAAAAAQPAAQQLQLQQQANASSSAMFDSEDKLLSVAHITTSPTELHSEGKEDDVI